jgi:hypothetical protein
MIRAAGVLAVVASVALFGVLLRSVHSAELSGTAADVGLDIRAGFDGPENGKFVFMFSAIVAAPVALWGLAALGAAIGRRRPGESGPP